MNWQDTPIYINNFNNLDRGFRRLVEWLRKVGMNQILVIDNHSTYEPLLAYYKEEKLEGVYLTENLGHTALWQLGLYKNQERFILTDPDVVPDKDCPFDLVRMLHIVMDMYGCKVGAGIRIDNLPDCFVGKQRVIAGESKYWISRKDRYCFNAAVDTTFALYSRDWNTHFPGSQHLRLDFPYVVEHVPWYEDSSKNNEERNFYAATARRDVAHWGLPEYDSGKY